MNKQIVTLDNWFDSLVVDCRRIIEEAKHRAGMILIKAKYDLGNRILPDYEKFGRGEYGYFTQEDLAKELVTSQQRISENINFAKKINLEYETFDKFRLSTDQSVLSWKEIVHEWIPRNNRKKSLISETADIDSPTFKVLLGDFRDRGEEIPDNSIHLLLTDPPYGEDYLDLWAPLSELANRVLVPGGFLVTYSGQFYLPEVLESLKSNLEYFWAFSLKLHNRNLVNPRSIYNIWKPILIFYKGPLLLPTSYLVDHITGSGREKELHDWQQSEQEIDIFIESFCPQGGLVLDPMAGSGTTLASALRLNRKAIGIEIVPENVEEMRKRLA